LPLIINNRNLIIGVLLFSIFLINFAIAGSFLEVDGDLDFGEDDPGVVIYSDPVVVKNINQGENSTLVMYLPGPLKMPAVTYTSSIVSTPFGE